MLSSFFGSFALGVLRPDRAFANINLFSFCRNLSSVPVVQSFYYTLSIFYRDPYSTYELAGYKEFDSYVHVE